jgi:hypothetical protein
MGAVAERNAAAYTSSAASGPAGEAISAARPAAAAHATAEWVTA